MKFKKLIVFISFFSLLFTSLNVTSDNDVNNTTDNNVSYEVLNHNKLKTKNKTTFSYSLEDDISCYVVDLSEMCYLERRDVDNYLDKGGVIIVNNKDVQINDFQEITASELDTVYFTENENKEGCFIFKNIDHLELWSYALDFINDIGIETINELLKFIAEVKSNILIRTIINWKIQLIKKIIEGSKSKQEEKTCNLGTARTAMLVTLLSNPNELACSYELQGTVIQGKKYIDKSTGYRRGIYDIVTKFSVDAENKYAITEYTTNISSDEEIIDATYISSNVTKQYTLGGQLGFQGDEVGVNASFNYSYSGSSTSQNVVNDFPFGRNYRSWKMKPFEKVYGATYYVEPGMRILSKNDRQTMSASLKFTSITEETTRKVYHLDDSFRKILKISWSADEEISQTESIGA